MTTTIDQGVAFPGQSISRANNVSLFDLQPGEKLSAATWGRVLSSHLRQDVGDERLLGAQHGAKSACVVR